MTLFPDTLENKSKNANEESYKNIWNNNDHTNTAFVIHRFSGQGF